MTELTLENFLVICGLFATGFGAWMLRIEKILWSMCTRITRTETKEDIYHNGDKKPND